MIDIWGFSAQELAPGPSAAVPLAGPTEDGLQQDEVDLAMVGAERAEPLPDLLDQVGDAPEAHAETDLLAPEPVAQSADFDGPSAALSSFEAEEGPLAPFVADIPAEAFEVPTAREPLPPIAQAAEQDALDRLAQKLAAMDGMNVRSKLAEFE
jgi:hypothetical protein